MRINKLLLIFSVVYCFLSYLLVVAQRHDNASNSLGYVFLFPAFWIVGGIVLWWLYKVADIKTGSVLDWVFLIFSTPIATILIMAVIPIPNEIITTNFRKNNYLGKKVAYSDSTGNLERVEYYKSKDTINAANTFPTTGACQYTGGKASAEQTNIIQLYQ
jgi:hypothetical protein